MKTKSLSAIVFFITIIFNHSLSNAQTWDLNGNASAINTSKLGTTTANINLNLWAGNLERIRILGTNGNVGIGTTAPTSKLHVLGTSLLQGTTTLQGAATFTTTAAIAGNTRIGAGAPNSVTGYSVLSINNPTTGGIIDFMNNGVMKMRLVNTSTTGAIETGSGVSILFKPANSEKMRITSTGFVGIGTTTPVAKIQILGGVDASLTSNGSLVIGDTAGTNMVIDNNEIISRNNGAANKLYINPGSGDVIMASGGNVGIGTSSPVYRLDVCGTIRGEEVRVATGWCDYVFADDYKLPPLSEVENFIKINKHLPDVTPGNIIEAEGLEVGKVSAQMIKKIEELTLYVIELQKEVEKLKSSK